MFSAIKALLSGGSDTDTSVDHEAQLRLATATLLVEAACMDGVFDDDERACIELLLKDRFALDAEGVDQLLSDASKKAEESAEIYGFTRTLKDRFSYEERLEMIEMLWEVAYADGKLDPHEDSLLRRVSGLLYVEDKDTGSARKRVIQKLESQGQIITR